MVSREDLKERYASLSDESLIELTVGEAGQLTPEALEVLKAELHKRGFEHQLGEVVAIQTRPLAEGELDEMVEQARLFPCPWCGSQERPLNATKLGTGRIVVGCVPCIGREASKEMGLALAWFLLPFG